ncbi:MAG: cofactor-independent phosphoglycerate mutase [Chloroflexi bacterium]|nr:cofactor-independent phosphoglycerate mutase [Chloroflexota bacterium]
MKYCILIMDGAAGWPLPDHGGNTCLSLARTPNLDAMARSGMVGLVRTVPPGMEPGSAVACMSVLGYDPAVYYRGRAAIEAQSMGVPVGPGEVVFRCNLVSMKDGEMASYSCGHISTEEARELITSLQERLGNDTVNFFPGVAYRHLCKIRGREDTLQAVCTPPHDIPGQPVEKFLPHGVGGELLLDIMKQSQAVLKDHPVNTARRARGDMPATTVWLFWGTGRIPKMPPFKKLRGLDASMTSGVDLLRGLAKMASMEILEIPGVSDGPDNDYSAQAQGALKALEKLDLVVIHVESPDEAGHAGSIAQKVEGIEHIDREIAGRIRDAGQDRIRVLVMPDHPTPIKVQTHVPDPVPFLLWGEGFLGTGAKRFVESDAVERHLLIDKGYTLIERLISGRQE